MPEEGTRLLEEAQNLLEEFTQLCSTGDDGFSEDPAAPETMDKCINGEANGDMAPGAREGERRTPSSLALSKTSATGGKRLQENLAVDPDDITPETESHDSHVRCVPPTPSNDVVEDENGDRFEDAVSEFPDHTVMKIAPPLQLSPQPTNLSSTTNNHQRTTSFTPTSLPTSSPTLLGDLRKISPYLPSPPALGPVDTETTDGGRVGVVFGGGGVGDGEGVGVAIEKSRGGEGEGVLERSMMEFDSFLEGVSGQDLAKVCTIPSCSRHVIFAQCILWFCSFTLNPTNAHSFFILNEGREITEGKNTLCMTKGNSSYINIFIYGTTAFTEKF